MTDKRPHLQEPAMTIPFPGHAAPTASTDVPLEMLAACHLRIRHQCATLRRLADYLPTRGSDEQAQQAATAVLRYFDTAAAHHHADEEEDLFPALLESVAGSDPVCIRELIYTLEREHRRLDAAWRHLRKALVDIADGRQAVLDPAQVDGFVQAYERHIELEEADLLPLADRLLDQRQIEALGLAMRSRRGLGAD